MISRRLLRGLQALAVLVLTGAPAAQAQASAPTLPMCPPWEPASAPYLGDAAAAVRRAPGIPDADRETLAMMAGQKFGGQRVAVTRDGIVGANLADLRGMNGAGGHVCAGLVNRAHWPAGRHETAWAYTVGRTSVVVLDSCGNVAVATNLDALPEPLTGRQAALAQRQAAAAQRQGLGALAWLLPPNVTASNAVPEPATLWLLGAAAAGAALARRRARRNTQGNPQ